MIAPDAAPIEPRADDRWSETDALLAERWERWRTELWGPPTLHPVLPSGWRRRGLRHLRPEQRHVRLMEPERTRRPIDERGLAALYSYRDPREPDDESTGQVFATAVWFLAIELLLFYVLLVAPSHLAALFNALGGH